MREVTCSIIWLCQCFTVYHSRFIQRGHKSTDCIEQHGRYSLLTRCSEKKTKPLKRPYHAVHEVKYFHFGWIYPERKNPVIWIKKKINGKENWYNLNFKREKKTINFAIIHICQKILDQPQFCCSDEWGSLFLNRLFPQEIIRDHTTLLVRLLDGLLAYMVLMAHCSQSLFLLDCHKISNCLHLFQCLFSAAL